jgi:hypothetical protein
MRTSTPARNDRQFNSVEAIEQRLARIENMRRRLEKTLVAERLPTLRIGSEEQLARLTQRSTAGPWMAEVGGSIPLNVHNKGAS